MTMTYHPVTSEDIQHVAAHMRADDVLEVAASHGHTPLEALSLSVIESDRSFVARWNGEPVCVFGFAEVAEGLAAVWLLGTDKLVSKECRREFLRVSRRILDRWAETFGRLFNYVDESSVTTRRWLRWLGFEETLTVPSFGAAEIPFVLVTKTHV